MEIVSKNKKAEFDYFLEDTFTAGISLLPTEIKSIRENNCNINQAYCYIENFEIFISGFYIAEYKKAFKNTNHNPNRIKKLLLKKTEINKIYGKQTKKNYTIIPLEILLNDNGLIKIKISLAIGKKKFDKRQDIKEKDTAKIERNQNKIKLLF